MTVLPRDLSVLYVGGTGTISASCVRRSVAAGMSVYVLNRGRNIKNRALPDEVTWLQAGPWDQSARAFSPDGGSVLFATDADGRQDISAYDLKTGKAAKTALPAGFNSVREDGAFARDGRLLASHDASNTPFDYWVLDKAGKAVRVTKLAAPGLESSHVPVSRIVHYKSADGTLNGPWSSHQPFTVQTDTPAALTVTSTSYPSGTWTAQKA